MMLMQSSDVSRGLNPFFSSKSPGRCITCDDSDAVKAEESEGLEAEEELKDICGIDEVGRTEGAC